MVGGLRVVMFAMLAWGSLSFAALPAEGKRQDLQTISFWMAHLNHYYPTLQVAPASDSNLASPEVREQLMQELGDLEELMGRGVNLPNASLKQISCGRPECNGGSGGKCSTCEVVKD